MNLYQLMVQKGELKLKLSRSSGFGLRNIETRKPSMLLTVEEESGEESKSIENPKSHDGQEEISPEQAALSLITMPECRNTPDNPSLDIFMHSPEEPAEKVAARPVSEEPLSTVEGKGHPGEEIIDIESNEGLNVPSSSDASSRKMQLIGEIITIVETAHQTSSEKPEMSCEEGLRNEIGVCDEWDPDEVCSPVQLKVPAPITLADDVPFEPARPLAVKIPLFSTARTDGFIDDLIRVSGGT